MSEPRYPYVHVEVDVDQVEFMGDRLWVLGAQGIEERDESTLDHASASGRVLLIASFANEETAQSASAMIDGSTVEHVVGDEWRDGWRKYFKPTRLGPRLWIRPSWEPLETGPDEIVLTIDPGNAFGSGIHETTRLVMREIDARVQGGERVLDLGCGSGILSIAARLLGSGPAVGVDVEVEAIRVTGENAEINGVDVSASTTPIDEVEGEYDLVFANIQAKVLIPMAKAIEARVAPGGVLILSGVLGDQVDDVSAAYTLERESVTAENDWRALIFRR